MMVSPLGYKILVLTSVYPADDVPKEWTPIVHYFTREWVKSGNEIRVVNYVSRFPFFFYCIARWFKESISSKAGFVIEYKPLLQRTYKYDGVDVFRVSLKKTKPHGKYHPRAIRKAIRLTKLYCEQNGFRPDVIISHWANPSVPIMMELKWAYNCRTAYIAHDGAHFEVFGKDEDRCLEAIDKIGFRSEYIKHRFETEPKYVKPSFMCYSGIPSKYVEENHRKSINEIRRFLYVGTLIGRKYPAEIITALKRSFVEDDFVMTFIGQGKEADKVIMVANNLNVGDKVQLLGRMERDEVVRQMDKSDVFIMISRNETFGLVYLEAMARGCITIASRKEGFDGIIQDGVNGFLCDAGNADELASIILRLRQMPVDELQRISDAAVKTACELTDEKVAAYYLSQVVE